MYQELFGEKVRYLRKRKGLTIVELAERAGVTEEHLGRIERGISSASFGLIVRLSSVLNTEPFNLFLFSEKDILEYKNVVQALSRSNDEVFLIIDKEGRIIEASDALCKVLECTMEEIIGSVSYEFMEYKVAEYRKLKVHQAIASRMRVHFIDFEAGRRISNTLYPLLNHDGEVYRIAILARDITDQDQDLE